MSDYIKRSDAAKILLQRREFADNQDWPQEVDLMELLCERLDEIPAADVVERKCIKPKTNADRIRSMTDKELAVWLAGAMLYGEPLKVMRIADWEKWLKQESKEWNLT